jgi:hypothetical protein
MHNVVAAAAPYLWTSPASADGSGAWAAEAATIAALGPSCKAIPVTGAGSVMLTGSISNFPPQFSRLCPLICAIFFIYVYWEGKVLLYIYPTSL